MTTRPTTMARASLLAGLLVALTCVAVVAPSPAAADSTPQVLYHDLAGNSLLEGVVAVGAMLPQPRPEVFDQEPPSHVGVVAFGPANSASQRSPSIAFGTEVAAAHPERVYVSIAVDPRDLYDVDRGILEKPLKTGPAWTRGAWVTVFKDGAPSATSAAGFCVHGGQSRSRQRKSFRLHFEATHGATCAPSDVLPGARGESLVLHGDWRRRRFVNPLGYEWLERCGVEVPRTLPVRLIINGKVQRGVYFATEHIDESHVRQRFGRENIQLQPEHDRVRSGHYLQIVRALKHEPQPMTPARVRPWFDLEGVERWLTAILFLAPYDCLQGFAHRSPESPRWQWIAWDVDWGLGPWPKTVGRRTVTFRSVVDLLMRRTRDLRATWFQTAMKAPGFRRDRILARVRAMLDHEDPMAWWRPVLERYRAVARRMLGDEAERELEILDDIETWVAQRPAELRANLAQTLELRPAQEVRVLVARGSAVSVEGRRYQDDWTGHAFHGERLFLAAAPGCSITRLGAPLGARWSMLHTVDGPATFVVDRAR